MTVEAVEDWIDAAYCLKMDFAEEHAKTMRSQ